MTTKVTKRYKQKVKITKSWILEVDVEDHESPGIRSVGWISSATDALDACNDLEPVHVAIDKIEGDPPVQVRSIND